MHTVKYFDMALNIKSILRHILQKANKVTTTSVLLNHIDIH